MATLDHIGLNRYIYMTASADTMTLGSHTVSDFSNSAGNAILGGNLDDSRLLLGINLYKNGPYGHSSWQQLRLSENPLSRHLRKNNQFPIVKNGKQRIFFVDGKRQVVKDRYGAQLVLDEPAVVSSYKPVLLIGTIDDYNENGGYFANRFRKKISLNNNIAYFTNDQINNIAGVVENEDEFYDILKSYYLEDAINVGDSPLSSFEKLVFSQNIYPPQQYTYKSYTRARTNFSFNWRDSLTDRQQINVNNNFGRNILSSSIWPLDVDPDWQNFTLPLIQHLGLAYYDSSEILISSSFGILWNHYSQFAYELLNTGSLKDPQNSKLSPGPIYARRHTLIPSQSVTSPTGQPNLRRDTNLTLDTVFGGEAYWDTPVQSGKAPFYDSYEDFSEDIKRKAKNYSIVPEFKMSDHVESLLSSSALSTLDNMFSITGAKTGADDSTTKEFYEIYSNSDFLKNFDVVLEDHKDFTTPSKITINCKAIKKFVPYNGFYPAQRTVNLAEQFYSSFSSHTKILEGVSTTFDFGFQNLLGPLFGPGVLFNSIKSGIACDYPIITASLGITATANSGEGDSTFFTDYRIQNSSFDLRIPFESLVEPEKYLANEILTCNEIHPSGNVSSSVYWDGNGDKLYTRMANNFLAEVPNFFLKNEKFSTIASLPQRDPNFGQVTNEFEAYSMRIQLYRSMDTPNTFVTNSVGINYQPPQDTIQGQKETLTMYSRPSAFGPPSAGKLSKGGGSWNIPDNSTIKEVGGALFSNSTDGINYPFTPPYYHGTSWADIVFKPAEKRKYTIDEIIASSSVEYYRFDHTPYTHAATGLTTPVGPQAINAINDNAMQISASLNIFGKGFLGESALELLNVQVDDQTRSRWIIQPKFETPILNFKDYVGTDPSTHASSVTLPNNASSASVPVGMWHQYGVVPEEKDGVYMHVTDVPAQWLRGREGKSQANIRLTGSLADLCGFSTDPVKLGKPANRKKISECVVAVPFIENNSTKEFFKLDKKRVKSILGGKPDGQDETLIELVQNLKDFIFPPTLDFVNFPKEVDPIAMYCFRFDHVFDQQDLTDIWQNLSPKISREFQESQASISHSLMRRTTMIKGGNLREDLRWMVFKVKQRAAANYYDQVFSKKGDKTSFVDAALDLTSTGPEDNIQYNWPYDFFSLVELVKIDASVEFYDVDTDDDGQEVAKPKVAKEVNRDIQLGTLFPKGKK